MKTQSLHIVAVSGSLRAGSLNRKALAVAKRIALDLGAEVEEIDLAKLELPVFNEDIRVHGFPESVKTLKNKIQSADILLIATPEYNHSIPGPLKNAIDWASDKTNPFSGKIAAIFGASNGPNGTLRAQLHLRQVLASLNVTVVPQPQVFIRFAQESFLVDGSFSDAQIPKQLQKLITAALRFAQQSRITEEVHQ